MKLMNDCRSIAEYLAQGSDPAGRLTLSMRLHLLICRHCRRYRAQLRMIGTAARNLWNAASDDSTRKLRDRILADRPETGGKQGR